MGDDLEVSSEYQMKDGGLKRDAELTVMALLREKRVDRKGFLK